jgi:hypothetical protein
MHTYDCETCGIVVEIEDYEAMFGHHEHYEASLCLSCFDKSLEEETK